MKRYLVFAGQDYYAGGGWIDFREDFDDLESAETAARTIIVERDLEWWHVVDTSTGEIVKALSGGYCGQWVVIEHVGR